MKLTPFEITNPNPAELKSTGTKSHQILELITTEILTSVQKIKAIVVGGKILISKTHTPEKGDSEAPRLTQPGFQAYL